MFFTNFISISLETIYTGTLSPNAVVNSYISVGNENSIGICVCKVNRYQDIKTADCEIQHNVDEITSAFVKQGAVATTGTIIETIDIS